MGQLAVVLLALFAQMERTYSRERAAGARDAATAQGRRIGRPTVIDPAKLAYALHLRDTGATIADIVTQTGITRTSLYRHLPPRPAEPITAAGACLPPPRPDPDPEGELEPGRPAARARGNLESITWPTGYAPACPVCTQATTGLQETRARAHGHVVIVAVAQPCGHPVDEHAAALQAGAPATGSSVLW